MNDDYSDVSGRVVRHSFEEEGRDPDTVEVTGEYVQFKLGETMGVLFPSLEITLARNMTWDKIRQTYTKEKFTSPIFVGILYVGIDKTGFRECKNLQYFQQVPV